MPCPSSWSAVFGFALAAFAGPAFAQASAPMPGSAATEQAPASPAPLRLTLSYYGDAFDDASGGLSPGATYQGRLGLILDADLQALLGWKGATAHASVHQIHGQGVTQDHVGALMAVSGIEAEPTTRLFNLWIEQKVGDRLAVRVGQFTAGQEFFISSGAALFVNSTFGWPAILAQDLPSGGPAYPLATPGVRVSLKPDARTTVLAAVFNGDPAGPGGGDPQQRDRTGLNGLRLAGQPFVIGEIQRAFGHADDPDTQVRLGAWAFPGEVPDQRYDDRGGVLGDPASDGVPAPRGGDHGVYVIVDQVLWRAGGHRLAAFFRASSSPGDRNLVDAYADAGLSYAGLLPGRPADVAGVAVGYSRISAGARARDADVRRLTGLATPVRDHEVVVELTYQLQVSAHVTLQPDLQYVLHPGGGAGAPGAADPTAIAPDALVVGLRTAVRY